VVSYDDFHEFLVQELWAKYGTYEPSLLIKKHMEVAIKWNKLNQLIVTEERADETSLALGSPFSKQTPRGSSLTNRGRTPWELQVLIIGLWLASPKITAKTASNPPAPGTPANNTPSVSMVRSKIWVCDSGSIYMNKWTCIRERFAGRLFFF
jgi:hypothetical protein